MRGNTLYFGNTRTVAINVPIRIPIIRPVIAIINVFCRPSITVTYPYVFKENTTLDLSATGANIQGGVGTYEGLEVDATTGKFADNNGGWVQVNTGTIIKLNVLEGAQVSVVAYSSADSFTIEVIDGVATITCVANDYLKSITVTY